MKQCDVVVVGAGAVGASAALGLAKQGRQVVLLERAVPPEFRADDDYDLRVFAISLASEQLFRELGVWDGMAARRVCPYGDMQVWDAGGDAELHFSAEDVHHTHLGHIIENKVIVASLLDAVRAEPNIEFICDAVMASLELDEPERPRIELADGRSFAPRLVVGADGARSQVRQLAGIGVASGSYEQQGIVAVVKTRVDHRGAAWQRFLPTGPLAFLPLGDGRCSIVWSAEDAQARELLALDEADFALALARALEFRLGEVVAVGPRAAFPLGHLHAEEYVKAGLVLLGDAAHVIHPLAGQGVNLGLMDVATLLEELEAKPGAVSFSALRRYARRRRHANQMMQSSMTAMHHLFRSGDPRLRSLRNAGVSVVARAAGIRRQFALRAAGLEGDVPEFIARAVRKI